jgi:2-polyprenyl-3-methyl-5-hydroxy-6-metoxy-1,4-benzoquinol methylase
MELTTAIRLLSEGIPAAATSQRWADLGAGSGLFTQALASLLPPGSTIVAVDTNRVGLNSIKATSEVTIQKSEENFELLSFGDSFHGVLMANALHYVRDGRQFLQALRSRLLPGGRLLFVEYDLTEANPWVPFPVSFAKLNQLALSAGFSKVEPLAQTPSVYQRAPIYSAVVL